MRFHSRTHYPLEGCDSRVERSNFVGHLRHWDVHGRTWILIKSTVTRVTNNADDLPRRFAENWSHARADFDAIVQRIAFRPELPCHSFVDDDHARRRSGVALS